MNFKELMTKLATEGGDNPLFSEEELKSVVDEMTEKDDELGRLRDALAKEKEEHENLKNRVVDHLFSNPMGSAPAEEQTKPEEAKPKTFSDLIDPEYAVRN